LDSDKRCDQCSEKVTKLKEIEKAQKEFDDANKKLETVSKEFAEYEEKIAVLEKELETNTSNLTKKQDTLESNIFKIEKKREKQLAEIDAEIENLKNQESNIKSTKAQKEAELARAFFLAFGKKNKLREEIATLTDNLVLLSKNIIISCKKR
jgi:chromosome segregation ATPase